MAASPEFEDADGAAALHRPCDLHARALSRGPRGRRHRADRRAVRRRRDQPHRHPARAARDPQPELADAQDQPGERDRALRALPGRRSGRRLGAAAVPSRELARRDRGVLSRTCTRPAIVPLSAGGDHSISLPILRAIAAERPVGMVHFDAHCDTGSNYLGSNYHHGAPFARAVEEGLLDPKRTVQIGIRGGVNDRDVWRFSHESGMRVIYMPEFLEMGLAGGDRRGAPRGRRRPDLRQLRHRQPGPGLCARHRHARDRRLHHASRRS